MQINYEMKIKEVVFIIWLVFGLVFTISGQRSFTLDEAISYGIEHHRDVKQADLDILTNEANIKAVRSIGLPHVDGKVDYSYYFYTPKQPVKDFISPAVYKILAAEGLPTMTQGPPRTFELSFVQPQQLNIGASAGMLLFDGSYLVALKASRQFKELARLKKEATVEEIKSRVVRAYLNVINLIEAQKTIRDNIQLITELKEDTKQMHHAGFVDEIEVQKVDLTLEQLLTQDSNMDGLIEISTNLLKFTMGYPIEEEISVGESMDNLLVRFVVDLGQIEMDPSQRLPYALLEMGQQVNDLDIQRYKKGYLPSVNTFASFRESLQRSNLFDGEQSGFLPTGLIGLNVGIPIYDGGKKRAEIEKVKIKKDKIELQKEQFVAGMKLQINNALVSVKNGEKNLQSGMDNLALSQKIYDSVKEKFRQGLASSFELRMAEKDIYSAQAKIINAKSDILNAKVDIYVALGKL